MKEQPRSAVSLTMNLVGVADEEDAKFKSSISREDRKRLRSLESAVLERLSNPEVLASAMANPLAFLRELGPLPEGLEPLLARLNRERAARELTPAASKEPPSLSVDVVVKRRGGA